jgi:hypothetical protein
MQSTLVLECGHCGNLSKHNVIHRHCAPLLFDEVEEQVLYEDYEWLTYECSTCNGICLHGGFVESEVDDREIHPRLYPHGSDLTPEPHKLAGTNPIPIRVRRIYEEAYPLRKRSPNSFVVQVRRALEFICDDKSAEGRHLFHKLEHLVKLGVFPGYFSEMTELLREVGNIGAHADENDADVWDAELVDDFFRAVVEYVYVAPSKIKRLKQRLSVRGNPRQ